MPFNCVYPACEIVESCGMLIFGSSSRKYFWSSNGFTLQGKNFAFCCTHTHTQMTFLFFPFNSYSYPH